MPSQQQLKWSELRVGLTVIFAAVVLAILIFLMTGTTGFFTKKITIRAYFDNASGLLKGSDIESMHIFRERFVQPVPTLNYSDHAHTVRTGIPHLFVANTTQIVNDTLNNNAMTRIARNACSILMNDLNDQVNARAMRVSALQRAHGTEVRV